ncbi:stage III sporulation protein AH [Oceanobacillus picturae]|uniref:Stage III sporulation protein AH n=1 Tax=Oceanobacillus picturae TaxID=171693 RepID=W9A8V5_9BACI|nr:SpoIIIAH-like family protein [Oceanobacillus picturae]GAQ16384.1 stage III sporulation protein AH [Oceanobacillus picturae]CDO01928.1 Stage III sporulation protein AH [Oceanobacillus picturae]
MLKKQTVWLLTMLSLMIVLSVYYMTSPDSEDLAYLNNGQDDSEEAASTDPTEDEGEADGNLDETEVDSISNLGENELFTTIRMELTDQRSKTKDRLTDVVASSSSSPEEKDEALKEIDVIEEVETKETILEGSIAESGEYPDVLVRSEDDKVHVHVRAEELSPTEANNIMQMVRDEFDRDVVVDVNYQPASSEEE